MSADFYVLISAFFLLLVGILIYAFAVAKAKPYMKIADERLFGQARRVDGFIETAIYSNVYTALYLFTFARRMKRHEKTYAVLDQLPRSQTWPFRLGAFGMLLVYIGFVIMILYELIVGV